MLWLLEFTRDGHRFRAELRPDPSGDPSSGMAQGFWFVSMDGNPPRLAFDAGVHDEDTDEFRGRVVSAALEEGGERTEPLQPRRVDPPADEHRETPENRPRHRH